MARRRVVISFETSRLDPGFFAFLVRVLGDREAPRDLTIRLERVDPDG